MDVHTKIDHRNSRILWVLFDPPSRRKTGIQHEIDHLEYEFEFESSKDGNTIEYLMGDGCFMISLGAKLTYPSCLVNSRNP